MLVINILAAYQIVYYTDSARLLANTTKDFAQAAGGASKSAMRDIINLRTDQTDWRLRPLVAVQIRYSERLL